MAEIGVNNIIPAKFILLLNAIVVAKKRIASPSLSFIYSVANKNLCFTKMSPSIGNVVFVFDLYKFFIIEPKWLFNGV